MIIILTVFRSRRNRHNLRCARRVDIRTLARTLHSCYRTALKLVLLLMCVGLYYDTSFTKCVQGYMYTAMTSVANVCHVTPISLSIWGMCLVVCHVSFAWTVCTSSVFISLYCAARFHNRLISGWIAIHPPSWCHVACHTLHPHNHKRGHLSLLNMLSPSALFLRSVACTVPCLLLPLLCKLWRAGETSS